MPMVQLQVFRPQQCADIKAKVCLFPRAMRKITMLAWVFDECREGQYPAPCGGVIDFV